ncbi:putative E3 ubiquitin ligase [Handroanthus impetiginosus]|uniref:Putative E3 ubiquitin ligase n=1 Tax=Handroanthus impetiginosus TaxID=429701 RepID=A0A2G9H7B7_9LAMI|nr:putative E3 ubiquitin ligase [Handroanthus impetiginosus]
MTACAEGSQPETPVARPAHRPPNHKPSPGESASSFAQETKGKLSGGGRQNLSSQGMVIDGKLGANRGGLSINSKRDMLRQKTFHSEKNHKGRLSKGVFKAKVAAWGSMVVDKALKSQSGSSGVVMKGNSSNLTTAAGTNSSLMEGNHHLLSNSRSGVVAGTSSVKDSACTLPAVDSTYPGSSAPNTNIGPKGGQTNVSDAPHTFNYYALIPFDETLQKYVPVDDKDEAILKLVPHKEALNEELQGWTDWANKKIMQAARRLGKDQGELKKLRQEREELEKLKKEKQILEESTVKRLSEMECKLSTTTGQIEVGNSSIRRLEEENSLLKEDMVVAKLQAVKSATNLQEAMLREQEALRKLQLCDTEKGLLLEQLANLKCQKAELVGPLAKAKERHNQFKALSTHEAKENLKVAAQVDSLRRKKEEDNALTKADEDNIKQTAEKNMQKYKEDIKNLENMISELRLESDKAKIAALNMGYASLAKENVSTFVGTQLTNISKKLAGFQDSTGDIKQERECVMCMADEISVLFLPCAHQVLCDQCNILHEKQGMSDCPSCRTPIQKRISVSYRVM